MKKWIAVLLAATMMLSLLAGCGKKEATPGQTDGADASVSNQEPTYTYHGSYSGVSTWSPTDWQISSEYDMLGYTVSVFYGFWMNETRDGYDIVPELAADYPVDVTANYAGNAVYGVPADATEGYAWQITMRQDATWQDGTPITAHDVEYTLQQFLNPNMKNYRASLFYQGGAGLANAEGYYNSDKAGEVVLTCAADLGIAYGDLSAGEDGQYADAAGNKVFIGWSVPVEWLYGYTLYDYSGYLTPEDYATLSSQVNDDGYIPATDETLGALFNMTSTWGETEDDLVSYIFCENVAAPVEWDQVGFVQDDTYTFTLILKNPSTLFDLESNIGNLILVKEDLYEANKTEAGGLTKSSYGTAVDKFSSYGPYKLVSYQEAKEIVFEKNEAWFGYSDASYDGMYQTTGIVLQQIDEHTTQLSMFLQGNLDSVGLSAEDMEKYGTSDYVYYTPTSNTYYLALNTDFDMLRSRETSGINKTILTYKSFRQAMSYSFDRMDYVKSCAPVSNAAFGLLNDQYVCDPMTGERYRDSKYAKQILCEVYGVSDVSDLTGYNKDEATRLLQVAYDECYADGNISDTDVVEIEYHVYGTDSAYQKMVDYIQDALTDAAVGTSLEDRIRVVLIEDQDYYNTMTNGQDDMINGAWGGSELDPYAMMWCWTDPDTVMEYGFDVYQDLTLSVQGKEVTMSFNQWYNELCDGCYAIADLDVRNEILAGMEKGLLLNYHMIPIYSASGASLASHRIVYGSEEYINSIVGRGGIQFMTYTMDDAAWSEYCAQQNGQLSY